MLQVENNEVDRTCVVEDCISPDKHTLNLKSSQSAIDEAKRADARRQQEFIRCLQKMIKSTRVTDKHLENIQKNSKEYHMFDKQEAKLDSIHQTIEALDCALQKTLLQKQRILESCSGEDTMAVETTKVIVTLVDYLVKLQKRVEDKYRLKEKSYTENKLRLTQFNSDVDALSVWLDSTQTTLRQFNESSSSTKQSLEELLQVCLLLSISHIV